MISFKKSVMHEQAIKQHIDAVKELSGMKKLPFLLNFTESNDEIGFEALRVWSADQTLSQKRIAEAYVVKSLAGRVSITQHIRLNRPSCKVKIFQTVEEAKNWLGQIKQIRRGDSSNGK